MKDYHGTTRDYGCACTSPNCAGKIVMNSNNTACNIGWFVKSRSKKRMSSGCSFRATVVSHNLPNTSQRCRHFTTRCHNWNIRMHHNRRNQITRCMKGWSTLSAVGDPKWVCCKHPGLDHANGHRGTARAIAGAKKFVRTRLRRQEDRELNKIVRQEDDDAS